MNSSQFPQTQVGLPSTIKYELPPAVPESTRAYSVAVSPSGASIITGTALPTNVFVANNSMATAPTFTSQTLIFDIPAGQSSSVFMDVRETILNFRLAWSVTTASSVTGGFLQLISSAASFIDSLTLYHNNTPIEIVASYPQLFNLLLNSSVNTSERYGNMSIGLGCDNNGMSGIDLPHAATGTYSMNFAIPLLSIIGLNGGDKLLPIGSIGNLQLQVQTSNVLPVASYCTAVTTQPVITAPSLSEFTLNMKYIDVGDQAAALLRNTLVDGKWYMKCSSYVNNNFTIASGSSGSLSIPFQIRAASVKSLFVQHSIAMVAACPNGTFDAINPALTSLQCSIGGLKFPNKPLNPSQRPAECFSSLISAFGGLSLKSFGGTMTRSNYGATIPSLPTNPDTMLVVPASGVRAISAVNTATEVVVNFLNGHYQGFDLERMTGSLFSGVNTRTTPPYLDVVLGVASTSTITSFAWGLIDVIIEVDVNERSIKAFN